MPFVTWEHQEPAGLLAQSQAGLVRAVTGLPWTTGGGATMDELVSELRGVVVRTTMVGANLTTHPAPPPGSPAAVIPSLGDASYKNPWGRTVTACLLSTIVLLSGTKGGVPSDLQTHVRTFGGAAPAFGPAPDVANPWLVGAAIIAGSAAWTIACCYIGQKTAEVVDRDLARDADLAKMVQTHGAVLQIVEAHTAAEVAIGKPIALNAAEELALAELLKTQAVIAKKTNTPLPTSMPTGGDVLAGIALPLAVGLGIWVLSE